MPNTLPDSPSVSETAERVVVERLRGWLARSGLLRLDDRKLVDALRDNFGTLRLLCNAALRDASLPVELADIRTERAIGTSLVSLRLRDRTTSAASSSLHRVPTSALRAVAADRGPTPGPRTGDQSTPAPATGVPQQDAEDAVVIPFARPTAGTPQRDHKGTYRRRNDAAIALGYSSYAQRRRARRTGVGLRPGDVPAR